METKLDYLKDHLQTNIPTIVIIHKRVGQYPEKDFTTGQATGRMQTLYNFSLPNGRMVRHYAKEREEETLQHFNTGESVQVVRQEMNKDGRLMHFLVWTPVEGAEARAAANPQPMSNTRQTATERELKDREQAQEEKAITIQLNGLFQAYVSNPNFGVRDGETHEDVIKDALTFAVNAREAINRKAKEIHLGVPAIPSHPKELVQKVEDTFGTDPTVPPPESMLEYNQ